MDNKEELKKLIQIVERSKKWTMEHMSTLMGYGKNYLSDMLTPSGKVSDKALHKFKVYFEEILDKDTTKAVDMYEINKRIYKLPMLLQISRGQFISDMRLTKEDFDKIDYGHFEITREFIDRLISVYNINEDWLLNGRGEMTKRNLELSESERMYAVPEEENDDKIDAILRRVESIHINLNDTRQNVLLNQAIGRAQLNYLASMEADKVENKDEKFSNILKAQNESIEVILREIYRLRQMQKV